MYFEEGLKSAAVGADSCKRTAPRKPVIKASFQSLSLQNQGPNPFLKSSFSIEHNYFHFLPKTTLIFSSKKHGCFLELEIFLSPLFWFFLEENGSV